MFDEKNPFCCTQTEVFFLRGRRQIGSKRSQTPRSNYCTTTRRFTNGRRSFTIRSRDSNQIAKWKGIMLTELWLFWSDVCAPRQTVLYHEPNAIGRPVARQKRIKCHRFLPGLVAKCMNEPQRKGNFTDSTSLLAAVDLLGGLG